MSLRTAVVVRKIINKKIVPQRPVGRGNPGYPWHVIVRILVYAILSGIFTNKGLVTRLHQNPEITRKLGLRKAHRKSIARWKKNKWLLLQVVIYNLGNLVQVLVPTTKLVDSAPIVDENDSDAKKGKCSRGWFIGFKIHIVVNRLKIPSRAIFSTGV